MAAFRFTVEPTKNQLGDLHRHMGGRRFASTKTCASCGWVAEDVPLGERTFRCEVCLNTEDRDANAARNLAAWANAHAAQLTPDPEARGRVTKACGGTSAGRRATGGGTGPASSLV